MRRIYCTIGLWLEHSFLCIILHHIQYVHCTYMLGIFSLLYKLKLHWYEGRISLFGNIYFLIKGTVSQDFWPVLFLLKSSVWAPTLMDRLKQFNDIFCFRKRYSISKCDCSRSQWLWRHLICIVNEAIPTSCSRSQWLYQHVSA